MLMRLSRRARALTLAGLAAAAVLIAILLGSLVLRVDSVRAREIALAAAGGGEILGQEIDREGFWNEYSFDILNGDTWYEVEVNAFGSITGLESSRGGYGHWD